MLASVPVLAGRRHIRAAISWAGLVLLVVCALRMTEGTPMPGAAAVWGVLGTCALLWAGHPEVGWSPTRALAWRPAQFVGDVSYSIHLWHWPLIVILPYASGSDLGMLDSLAIALAALLPAVGCFAGWSVVERDNEARAAAAAAADALLTQHGGCFGAARDVPFGTPAEGCRTSRSSATPTPGR